jgi:hypothetical protein
MRVGSCGPFRVARSCMPPMPFQNIHQEHHAKTCSSAVVFVSGVYVLGAINANSCPLGSAADHDGGPVSAGYRRALLGGWVAHGRYLRRISQRVLPLQERFNGLLQSAPDGRRTSDVYTDLRASPVSRYGPSRAAWAHMWPLCAVMRNAFLQRPRTAAIRARQSRPSRPARPQVDSHSGTRPAVCRRRITLFTAWARCAGAYVFGAVGSNSCPAGSDRISTAAACRAAASATMLIYASASSTSSYPAGCYRWTLADQ